MPGYVTIGTSDFDVAIAFHDGLIAELGGNGTIRSRC